MKTFTVIFGIITTLCLFPAVYALIPVARGKSDFGDISMKPWFFFQFMFVIFEILYFMIYI